MPFNLHIDVLQQGLIQKFNILLDLEFKVVYVGSAESEAHDQTLESVMVGPVPVGTSKFRLEVRLVRHFFISFLEYKGEQVI